MREEEFGRQAGVRERVQSGLVGPTKSIRSYRWLPVESVIGTLMPSVASVYLCELSNSSETGILTSLE
jgi:hypothetical protein